MSFKLPVINNREVIAEVSSGAVVMETGADGTFIRFECDCTDALPYCKAACCSLPGIGITEEEKEKIDLIAPEGLGKITQADDEGGFEMVKGSDAACQCLCRNTRSCKIYEDRPKTCSDFHCTYGEGQRGWRLDIIRHEGYDD